MPNFLRPHPSVADSDAAFVQAEAETTLFAILSQFKKLWVNNPFNEKLTENKLYQLAIARDFGLRVPETIASSDVNALQEFWNKHEGEVIVKAVSAYPARYVSDGVIVTRQVSSNDIKLLKTSTPSVNLFQELIPAILDIRVTIVGDSVFATAIHSQEGKSPLDWRLDYTVPFTTYELDDKTLTALSQIASRLGLVYGAADLRIMPTGEPVFLEINPYGSFFFIEKLTNQPISGALADLLRSGKLTRPIYPAT